MAKHAHGWASDRRSVGRNHWLRPRVALGTPWSGNLNPGDTPRRTQRGLRPQPKQARGTGMDDPAFASIRVHSRSSPGSWVGPPGSAAAKPRESGKTQPRMNANGRESVHLRLDRRQAAFGRGPAGYGRTREEPCQENKRLTDSSTENTDRGLPGKSGAQTREPACREGWQTMARTATGSMRG